jgi:hypothetical protein
MTTKTKTITLTPSYHIENHESVVHGYRVERCTNSLDYIPGTVITKREADALCLARDWTVTINRAKEP